MTQKCFFNGNIITMEHEIYADYLLIENMKIICVGNKKEIDKYIYDNAEMIDLQGKTLMPAFIDAHSHFTDYAGSLLHANLSNAECLDDIKSILLEYKEKNNIEKNQWIIASNYDNNFLKEKTNPTSDFIDSFLPDNPVVLEHQSGHSGVFNTKAKEILRITDDKKGFLEEEAFTERLEKTPIPDSSHLKTAAIEAQQKYASYGITTMQDGVIVDAMKKILELLIHENLLFLDLIGYADVKNGLSIPNDFHECVKKYKNRFKVGGYKVFLDGSPQSGTAWMLEPYKNTRLNGSPYYKDGELTRILKRSLSDKMQIIAHCNGDCATKQYIECYDDALKQTREKTDIRPVIIHAQFLTENQLDDVKRLKMIPSFFVAHVYYWGDIHIHNFGLKRASQISIAKSAENKNILFTFHQDSPVIEPNMLETIWCAVNRITKNGVVLGENQKITPLEALKAVTINAAYQYFEEDLKGSLKVGKQADLVILDRDPLKIEPLEIKNIKVLETIKEGKTVFKAD